MNDAGATRRRRSRWLICAIAVLVAAGLTGGGWFAAAAFTSPAQRAAAASPPPAAPILVKVESGDLADIRTLTGTIRPIDSFSAPLPVLPGADRTIVTSISVTNGKEVSVGSMVATMNDRPVFAIKSPFPLYRDIGVGDRGADVRALQESLVSSGLLSFADGEFGPATATAVKALFARAGYDVPLRDASATHTPTSDAPASDDDAAAKPPAAKPAQVVYFPAAAALTVATLPATAASLPTVGTDVSSGATFDFAAPSLAVFATPPNSLPQGLKPGTKVTISGGGLENAPATVMGPISPPDPASAPTASPDAGNGDPGAADTARRAQATSGDVQASQSEVRIDLDNGTTVKQDQVGQSVTVTATVELVAKDALLVPVTAVNEEDPTHGYVVVESGARASESVAVTILGTVGGRVALKPGETLATGDRVRVG